MRIGNQCCCQQNGMTKSVSYSSTTFQVMGHHTGKQTLRAQQATHSNNGSHSPLTSFVRSMPDIRSLLKPWYFRDAAQHNFNIAREFAMGVVQQPTWDNAMSFHTVVKRVQFEFHIADSHNCLAKISKPEVLLSDNDKCLLEKLYDVMESMGEDVESVSKIASRLVFERMGKGDVTIASLKPDKLVNMLKECNGLGVEQLTELERRLKECFRPEGQSDSI